MNNKLQYWIELNRVKLFYKKTFKCKVIKIDSQIIIIFVNMNPWLGTLCILRYKDLKLGFPVIWLSRMLSTKQRERQRKITNCAPLRCFFLCQYLRFSLLDQLPPLSHSLLMKSYLCWAEKYLLPTIVENCHPSLFIVSFFFGHAFY